MTGEKTVKLMRSPIDTHCGDCKKALAFGTWVYYNPQSGEAICPECAVKKGWTPKQRVKQLIKTLELREDIKTLRKQRKIEADALLLLRQKINLHRLGERDIELETQISTLIDTVQDYLRQCGTPKEKEALQEICDVIRQTQELQKEVRDQVQNHLLLIKRKEAKQEKRLLA